MGIWTSLSDDAGPPGLDDLEIHTAPTERISAESLWLLTVTLMNHRVMRPECI